MFSPVKCFVILSFLFAAIFALPKSLVKRRENQENPAMLSEIHDLEKTAQLRNGRFEQITKAFVSTLLDGADPCDRYTFIDEIIKLCKAGNCGREGIQVAAKLAMLEKNFNVVTGARKPAFCNNPSIPTSPEIRCIVPVIDPDFPGATEFNLKAKARFVDIQANPNPGLCAGQSIQQQVLALGISGCKGCNAASAASVGIRIASDVFSQLFDFRSVIGESAVAAVETEVCEREPSLPNASKPVDASPNRSKDTVPPASIGSGTSKPVDASPNKLQSGGGNPANTNPTPTENCENVPAKATAPASSSKGTLSISVIKESDTDH